MLRAAWFAVLAWLAQGGLPPVVLVPGVTGSSVEARLTNVSMPHSFCTSSTDGHWEITWMRVLELLPFFKDCFETKMYLIYDNQTDTYTNTPGVELRVLDFGGVSGIDILDPDVPDTSQFQQIISSLSQRLGYVVGQNLHGAPFDWRLGGDAHSRPANNVGGFYVQLKALVEETVQRNGQKAVLVSHSLGCPTLLYFFHHFVTEEWRQTHIHGWVAMNGPWLGSVIQANSYLSGWTFGIPPWLLPHDYAKRLQVMAPSGVWLSPQPAGFGDAVIISTPSRNYTSADLPDIIRTIGEEAGGQQTLALFQKKWSELSEIQRPPSFVPMQNWYSFGVDTPERFVYDQDIAEGFNNAPRDIVMGDGDGVVNRVVLQQVERWPLDPSSPIVTRTFSNTSHYHMFFSKQVQDALVEYLSSGSSAADLYI